MAVKVEVMNQIVTDLATVFPGLTAKQEIYLVPMIKVVQAMAPLEIQVCESGVTYPEAEHDGSSRAEDFTVQIGIFRKYRLDSGGRHSKALSDLALSIYKLRDTVIDLLDWGFLTGEILVRPLIIRHESAVTEVADGQLLKTITFIAGDVTGY